MRIAIIRLSSLGDVIVCAVFLKFIKKRIKNAHITWIVDSSFRQILEDSPYINDICDIPLRQSKKNKKLIFDIFKKIRGLERFDIVLDFQGLLKSAMIGKLLKSNEFIGYSKDSAREKLSSIFYTKKAHIKYEEHILKRQYAILKEAFLWDDEFNLKMLDDRNDILQSSQQAKTKILNLLDGAKTKILFILEASKQEKEYPIDSFYKLALGIKESYKDSRIYLIWDKKEDEIKALGARDSIFCVLERLNLDEIKGLISHMDLIIGGDTGITHLSWALNIPSVTLYGNTPIQRFKLEGKKYIAISKINQEKIIKGDFSIRKISPESILNAAKKILEKN